MEQVPGSAESARGQAVPVAGSRLVLRSRLGALTLLLLCAVQFLGIADAAIVNVALPSIQRSLHFSQQNLQWVASGYILTYGGFLLLGGRLGDLLGRRRMLITGLAVFALASLAAGLANTSGLLVAARLVQGAGGALMAPAALSELTTTFREGKDRDTALGAWGGDQRDGCRVLAITRTNDLIAAKASPVVALDAGYHRALLIGSIFMAVAALIALRIGNTRAAAPLVLLDTEPARQPAGR